MILKKHSLKGVQIAGFIFVGGAGVLLHYLYDWANESPFVALFSAVNESIWEHMKLLFVPMLAFAMFEHRLVKKDYPDFWCGKLAGVLVGLTIIPSLYYLYTGGLGINADWFNIAIYFIAAAAAFYIETIFIKNRFRCILSSKISLIVIIAIAACFVIFTFYPVPIPLFQDPVTKLYGTN